jgi:MtN3 and saliva related transmembrane protein
MPFLSWGKAEIVAMAASLIQAIGVLAATLTTVCWVPQAVKIIREKETRAISLPATALSAAGFLLWLVYGAAIIDAPLIGSSSITFVITATILALKIRHG